MEELPLVALNIMIIKDNIVPDGNVATLSDMTLGFYKPYVI